MNPLRPSEYDDPFTRRAVREMVQAQAAAVYRRARERFAEAERAARYAAKEAEKQAAYWAERPHGSTKRYAAGCRCKPCVEVHREYHRQGRLRYLARKAAEEAAKAAEARGGAGT